MSIPAPRLAVFKFASCDGCQLSLLDAEDELLELARLVEIAYFPEASSRMLDGPYDVCLVEGSITTPHDAERIREVRRQSRFLVTLGACATAGGIQALRNWGDSQEWLAAVYARPEYIRSLATSTAIGDHVPVDFELRGCPVDKRQLVEVVAALAAGRRPRTPAHSVCLDCKRSGAVCVLVARGVPCLGPVTQSGCGALCPTYDRGCYACFGPAPQANLVSLTDEFRRQGMPAAEAARSLRLFNGYAPEYRLESARLLAEAASVDARGAGSEPTGPGS